VLTLLLLMACSGDDAPLEIGGLTLEPANLQLGPVPTGTTTTATLTVRNDGATQKIVQAANGEGPCTVDTAPIPFPLDPGSAKELELRCKPESEGSFRSTILVAALQGSANLEVSDEAVQPRVRLRPSSLDLGSIPAGQEIAATIAMESVGSGPFDLTGVSFDQARWEAHTAVDLPLRVNPGLAVLIDISITPRDIGTTSTTASLQMGENSVNLPITLEVLPPEPGTVLPPEEPAPGAEAEVGAVADAGTVCPKLMGEDLGHVPPWTGTCDESKGFSSHGEHCYFPVKKDKLLWVDARASCKAAGGHLVTITDAEEHAFVSGIHPYTYVGGCDADAEGSFAWITGETMDWIKFNEGEPNDFGPGEDCLEAAATGFADVLCEEHYMAQGFVCEFE